MRAARTARSVVGASYLGDRCGSFFRVEPRADSAPRLPPRSAGRASRERRRRPSSARQGARMSGRVTGTDTRSFARGLPPDAAVFHPRSRVVRRSGLGSLVHRRRLWPAHAAGMARTQAREPAPPPALKTFPCPQRHGSSGGRRNVGGPQRVRRLGHRRATTGQRARPRCWTRPAGTWVAQGASPGKLRPAWLRKPPARGADGRHDTPASRGGEQGNAESAQSPEHRGPPRGGGPMTHIDDVADDIIDLALTAHLRVPHVPKVRAPRPGFPHLASRGVSTWGSGEVSPSERGGTGLRRLQG